MWLVIHWNSFYYIANAKDCRASEESTFWLKLNLKLLRIVRTMAYPDEWSEKFVIFQLNKYLSVHGNAYFGWIFSIVWVPQMYVCASGVNFKLSNKKKLVCDRVWEKRQPSNWNYISFSNYSFSTAVTRYIGLQEERSHCVLRFRLHHVRHPAPRVLSMRATTFVCMCVSVLVCCVHCYRRKCTYFTYTYRK